MEYLLGIDIGTSSIKIGLFDIEGNEIDIVSEKYQIQYPKNWAEVNPEIWWEKIIVGMNKLLKNNDIDSKNIISIGLSTLCPALIAVDKNYEALRPAILFYDQRSFEEAETLKNNPGEEKFLNLTGNKIISGASSLTSIYWIKNNEKDIYEKTKYFGHGNSYIAAKLTGEFVMDRTNASYMGVFNAKETFDWEHNLIEEIGLDKNKFPEVLLSSKIVGQVTLGAAKKTGLAAGTPVVIGGADTACSALALGIIEDGKVFESCGTSDVITICSKEAKFNEKFMNRCHVIDNYWLSHGAMSTPGATIEWLKNEIGLVESIEAEENDYNAYDIISNKAEKSPPGANGLIFLPYMYGERTPIWDTNARGVLFGLSLKTKREDIFRSVMEGISFNLKQIFKLIHQNWGIAVKEIKLVGGAADNKVWNQIRSDILQIDIEALKVKETAVLGAAILGGIGVGKIKNIKSFIENLNIEKIETFTPDKNYEDFYNNLFEVYISLYPLLKDKFEDMSYLFR